MEFKINQKLNFFKSKSKAFLTIFTLPPFFALTVMFSMGLQKISKQEFQDNNAIFKQ